MLKPFQSELSWKNAYVYWKISGHAYGKRTALSPTIPFANKCEMICLSKVYAIGWGKELCYLSQTVMSRSMFMNKHVHSLFLSKHFVNTLMTHNTIHLPNLLRKGGKLIQASPTVDTSLYWCMFFVHWKNINQAKHCSLSYSFI